MNALKVFAMASVSILVMTAVFVVVTGGGAEDNSPSRSELILQSPSEYDDGNVTVKGNIRGDFEGEVYNEIGVGNESMPVDGLTHVEYCGPQLNVALNRLGVEQRPDVYPPLETTITGTVENNSGYGYRLQCRSIKVHGIS